MQSSIALGSRTAVRVAPARPVIRAVAVAVSAEEERYRLNNLGPAPGSRKRKTRKGRGYSAGQVCGASVSLPLGSLRREKMQALWISLHMFSPDASTSSAFNTNAVFHVPVHGKCTERTPQVPVQDNPISQTAVSSYCVGTFVDKWQ